MEIIALGEMQMGEAEFYATTPRTFENKVIGFRRREEAQSREAWEIARQIGMRIMIPNLKKGTKIDGKVLFPTPWDQIVAKPKEDPKEAYKRAEAMWKKIDEKRALKE